MTEECKMIVKRSSEFGGHFKTNLKTLTYDWSNDLDRKFKIPWQRFLKFVWRKFYKIQFM